MTKSRTTENGKKGNTILKKLEIYDETIQRINEILTNLTLSNAISAGMLHFLLKFGTPKRKVN